MYVCMYVSSVKIAKLIAIMCDVNVNQLHVLSNTKIMLSLNPLLNPDPNADLKSSKTEWN